MRKELDFHCVPPDEIESCYYYEYARANEPITECVSRWRKMIGDPKRAYKAARTANNAEPRGKAFIEGLRELTPLVGQSYFVETAAFMLGCRCFPQMPWQLLRPKEKKWWKKSVGLHDSLRKWRRRFRTTDLSVVNLWPFYKAQRYDRANKPDIEVFGAEIDWRDGVEKVIEDFGIWARKHWRNWLEGKKRPRSTYAESLKQLGVLRLYNNMKSWPKVKAYMKEHGMPSYGDANNKDDISALRRAGIKAAKRKIFPIIVASQVRVPPNQQFAPRDLDIERFIKEFPIHIIAFESARRSTPPQ